MKFACGIPRRQSHLLLALTLPFMLVFPFQCSQVAGTVSDTDSGVKALLLNADLTPADSAIVNVYNYRDTTLAYQTVTDSNGHYSLDSLRGIYSIWAEKDSFVAYQDSVLLTNSNRKIARDTLLIPGRFTGRIAMELGDPYSAVTVHALGTHIHANVSDTGWFTLSGLADGEYVLRFSCGLSGYVTTYSDPVLVKSNKVTLRTEPFKIGYTGIPYVTGIVASYDTLASVVHLRWQSTHYFNFQEYVVFRRDPSMTSDFFNQIAVITDTMYSDNLIQPFADTNYGSYQYKIVIRDKFESLGRAYGNIEIAACSPDKATTTIAQSSGSVVKSTPGNNFTLIALISNPTRSIKRIQWRDQASDTILKSTTIGSSLNNLSDTLQFNPAGLGTFNLITEVKDNAGTLWTSHWVVFSQRAVMQSTHPAMTLTGIQIIQIRTDSTVKSVAAGLDNRFGQPVTVIDGFAACTLDTRIQFPASTAILKIREDLTVLDSERVLLDNSDPIIGCWVSQSDSLLKECYHEDGSIVSNRETGWLLGWTRNGQSITILQATSNGITFRPYFADFDHCTLNGIQCVRTSSTGLK